MNLRLPFQLDRNQRAILLQRGFTIDGVAHHPSAVMDMPESVQADDGFSLSWPTTLLSVPKS